VILLLFLLFLNLREIQTFVLKLFVGLVVRVIVFGCADFKPLLWGRFREMIEVWLLLTNE